MLGTWDDNQLNDLTTPEETAVNVDDPKQIYNHFAVKCEFVGVCCRYCGCSYCLFLFRICCCCLFGGVFLLFLVCVFSVCFLFVRSFWLANYLVLCFLFVFFFAFFGDGGGIFPLTLLLL